MILKLQSILCLLSISIIYMIPCIFSFNSNHFMYFKKISITKMNSKFVDPLDGLDVSERQLSKTIQSTFNFPHEVTLSETIGESEVFLNEESVSFKCDQLLLESDKKTLQSLPLLYRIEFDKITAKYINRIAAISIVVFAMMSLPLFPYIHFNLQTSIIPYLYIAPLIYIFPFLYFWLWENKFISSEIIIQYLITILKRETFLAEEKLKVEGDIMLFNLKNTINDYDAEMLHKFSLIRILSKIDIAYLVEEIKNVNVDERLNLLEEFPNTAQKISPGDYLSAAKIVANSIINSDDKNLQQDLLTLQDQMSTQEEKKTTENTIKKIENVFDALISKIKKDVKEV